MSDAFDPLVRDSDGESVDYGAGITDPDEMLQHRRLREIEDARQAVQDRAENAHGRYSDGQISYQTAVNVFYNSLLSYFEELRGLMLSEHKPLGEKYYENWELGEMTIYPPQGMSPDTEPHPFNDYKNVLEEPAPVSKPFNGIKDVVEAGSTVQATFRAKVRTRTDGTYSEEQTKAVPIDWKILRKAYQALTGFAAEVGLDVKYNDEVDVEAEPF